eukprot:GHVS01101439.1.p1 GENE.GHVS01101439.1~~GHVS01101439.1.p1  ORF type:complete len:172 (+),score=25.76 GHVS01101439.1:299-814(+)
MAEHHAASCSRRINRTRMPEFVGQLVRFVGRVESVEEDILTLEAPDGGEVRCVLSGLAQRPSSLIVEVIGEVQNDLTLKQTSFLFNLGDELGTTSSRSHSHRTSTLFFDTSKEKTLTAVVGVGGLSAFVGVSQICRLSTKASTSLSTRSSCNSLNRQNGHRGEKTEERAGQ